MKKKYAALIFAVVLAMTSISGCSGDTEDTETETVTSSDYAGSTIYGEVTDITDSVITINVGTMNQDDTEDTEGSDDVANAEAMSMVTDDSNDDTTDDASDNEDSDFSMLTLTGETLEITVTDDTVIYSRSMGGGMNGGGMGDMTGGGDMEMPDGDGTDMGEAPGGNSDSEIPDKPDGEDTDSEASGEAPDIPDGDGGDMGEAPDSDGEGGNMEMPDGDMSGSAETEEIELSDISVGDTISVTFDDDGNATEITVITAGGMGDMSEAGGMGGSGSTASGVDSYTVVTEYTTDTEVDGETYSSTGTDENAILVSGGATVTLDNITVTRESSDSTGGDNSSFYGVGAAILTTDGTTYISDADISTDSAGGAGVFAYGDGTVYVSDSTITTNQDTSGGIHVAGGGTLYAWDLTVETNGESAAAVRSDRGGGTMVVDGGSYTSNGTGSPAIYSTADITINDATLTATGSEAVCIEGLNSLRLFDCDLTGSMSDDSQNDCTWNVILYQSMSGDSEVGNSTFEMQGGSLTAKNGGMFYTTNTESTFTISDVDITYANDSEFFLKCTGNSNERGWGSSGSNGADCLFTAIDQEMEGLIIWDTISELDFYMTDGSTLTGAIEDDESNAGSGGDGYCNVYIDESSKWIVTGDSVLTALYCEGTITDASGNTVTIKGTDGTVYVSGTSSYVITVDTYEASVDTSGASTLSSWSDYEVEEP